MEESNGDENILSPKTTEEKLNYINFRGICLFLQVQAFSCKVFWKVNLSYMFPSVSNAPH